MLLFPTDVPDPSAPTASVATADPEPTAVLTPAAFTLPQTCDELAVYSEDQAGIVTTSPRGSQASVDAKAAYNASVFEQQLKECFE